MEKLCPNRITPNKTPRGAPCLNIVARKSQLLRGRESNQDSDEKENALAKQQNSGDVDPRKRGVGRKGVNNLSREAIKKNKWRASKSKEAIHGKMKSAQSKEAFKAKSRETCKKSKSKEGRRAGMSREALNLGELPKKKSSNEGNMTSKKTAIQKFKN